MRCIPLALALSGALAVPFGSHAEVYKWVDERGVINYGTKPPRDAVNVMKVDASGSNLRIIPTALPRTVPAQPERPLDNRRGGMAGSAVDRATLDQLDRALSWRERCFAERRVDCMNPTAATFDHTPSYAPPAR